MLKARTGVPGAAATFTTVARLLAVARLTAVAALAAVATLAPHGLLAQATPFNAEATISRYSATSRWVQP